jgi:lysophospholipase L1-like esterase
MKKNIILTFIAALLICSACKKGLSDYPSSKPIVDVPEVEVVAFDSTYRPDTYRQKVAEFNAQTRAATDIVFIGNSITAGTDWNTLLGLTIAKNRGISGDITYGVIERMQEVINGKPAKVFILIGINDLARGITEKYILKNYTRMIRLIKAGSPQTKIYFQGLLPVNETVLTSGAVKFPNHVNKRTEIQSINTKLSTICTNEGVTFVNLYDSFVDANGRMNSIYTYDGLHLSADGYQRWKTFLTTNSYL